MNRRALRAGRWALGACCGVVAFVAPASLRAQASASPAAPANANASALAWLAGCWELREGARVIVEQWMAPSGGVMLGMNHTVSAERSRAFEFMYLGPVDGRLSFVARPSGQAGATFPVVALDDSSVTFEQPAHDFPKRVEYRRRGSDVLYAQIEGPMNGEQLRVPFLFRRVACPGR